MICDNLRPVLISIPFIHSTNVLYLRSDGANVSHSDCRFCELIEITITSACVTHSRSFVNVSESGKAT